MTHSATLPLSAYSPPLPPLLYLPRYVPTAYPAYCDDMATATTWGDHVTLQAAAGEGWGEGGVGIR